MAVTTTTRFGITRWSAGTDPFTRAQMDASHAAIESLGAMYAAGTFAARPAAAAANAGEFYLATDTGVLYLSTGSAWRQVHTDGETTLRITQTFTLPGEIKVASGQTDFLPYVPVAVPAGQAVVAKRYAWVLHSGTSFTFNLSRRYQTTTPLDTGSAIVTGAVATGTPMAAAAAVDTERTFADGDAWRLQVTAVSGTPQNGAVSLIFDVTI